MHSRSMPGGWIEEVDMWSAQAVEKTGLGARIANLCISVLGKTSLGLAYGLACAELVLSPAMPSTTARAGGVFVSPLCQCLPEPQCPIA